MARNFKVFLKICIISLVPTILIWLPFFFRIGSLWGIPIPKDGMATVAANYDGPLYIVVAKTLYDPNSLGQIPFSLHSNYYAAHFPLYPILIKLFAGLFGFPYSMLFITLITSILCLYFFYKLIKDYVDENTAMWITIAFSILPARWLIVRSVGSPESLFLASIIASVYYFKNKKYFLSGVWGAIAQFTKSPGILLFIAYFFAIGIPLFKRYTTNSQKLQLLQEIKKYWGILLIPLSLLTIFYFLFRLALKRILQNPNVFYNFFKSPYFQGVKIMFVKPPKLP